MTTQKLVVTTLSLIGGGIGLFAPVGVVKWLLRTEPEDAGILTLFTIEQLLQTAKKPADVNQAIDLGVKHFRNKADHRIPKRGHRKFAQQLDQRRMRPAA